MVERWRKEGRLMGVGSTWARATSLHGIRPKALLLSSCSHHLYLGDFEASHNLPVMGSSVRVCCRHAQFV